MITARTKNLIACVLTAQAGKVTLPIKELPAHHDWHQTCKDVGGLPSLTAFDGIVIHFNVDFVQLCNPTI